MKILVVEDNPKHLKDAVAFFKTKKIEIATATSYNSAIAKLESLKAEDGWQAIIDIFLPWQDGGAADDPLGLVVVAKCKRRNIKSVLCTAGYHHGPKYEWIYRFTGALGWERPVDSGSNYHREAEKKDWDGAFETLQDRPPHLRVQVIEHIISGVV